MTDFFALPEPRLPRYSPAAAGHAWGVPGATVEGWIARGRLPERALVRDRHGVGLRGDWVESAWPRIGDGGAMWLELQDGNGQAFDWSPGAMLIDSHFREVEEREADLAENEAQPLQDPYEPGYTW